MTSGVLDRFMDSWIGKALMALAVPAVFAGAVAFLNTSFSVRSLAEKVETLQKADEKREADHERIIRIEEDVESLNEKVKAVGKDAREARDIARDIKAILETRTP